MSSPFWDRAASSPAVIDGRRRPEVATLPPGLPSVAALFDFMRDAELRFGTLRMRIEERSTTTRGEDLRTFDVAIRHPGEAKVTTSRSGGIVGGDYEIWISDGEIVRTYSGVHRTGTQRPIRNRPRGLDDHDFPGSARVYQPVTALPSETLPETFVHPAGLCQNVLATGRCQVVGVETAVGRDAIRLECQHPRTTELPGDRPDHRISVAVDRDTGLIVRLTQSMGGQVTRHAEVVDLATDGPLPPSMFEFVFPAGTTVLY